MNTIFQENKWRIHSASLSHNSLWAACHHHKFFHMSQNILTIARIDHICWDTEQTIPPLQCISVETASPLTPTSSSALHSACWKQVFDCSAAPAGLNSTLKKLPRVELIPARQQSHQAWYLYLYGSHDSSPARCRYELSSYETYHLTLPSSSAPGSLFLTWILAHWSQQAHLQQQQKQQLVDQVSSQLAVDHWATTSQTVGGGQHILKGCNTYQVKNAPLQQLIQMMLPAC